MSTLARLTKACEFAVEAAGTVEVVTLEGEEMYSLDSDRVKAAVERHYGTCAEDKVFHLMSYMAKFHIEGSCEMCYLLSIAHAASHIFQDEHHGGVVH